MMCSACVGGSCGCAALLPQPRSHTATYRIFAVSCCRSCRGWGCADRAAPGTLQVLTKVALTLLPVELGNYMLASEEPLHLAGEFRVLGPGTPGEYSMVGTALQHEPRCAIRTLSLSAQLLWHPHIAAWIL
jgi:hypothetical protein